MRVAASSSEWIFQRVKSLSSRSFLSRLMQIKLDNSAPAGMSFLIWRQSARDIPDPTADEDHIRSRVIASIEKNEWRPAQLGVTVRDGIVHVIGTITDERFRQATIVAAENVDGVKLVHDHLYLFDAMSGLWFRSSEDEEWAKAGQRAALPMLRGCWFACPSVNERDMVWTRRRLMTRENGGSAGDEIGMSEAFGVV
jgi:hypothetical protein